MYIYKKKKWLCRLVLRVRERATMFLFITRYNFYFAFISWRLESFIYLRYIFMHFKFMLSRLWQKSLNVRRECCYVRHCLCRLLTFKFFESQITLSNIHTILLNLIFFMIKVILSQKIHVFSLTLPTLNCYWQFLDKYWYEVRSSWSFC